MNVKLTADMVPAGRIARRMPWFDWTWLRTPIVAAFARVSGHPAPMSGKAHEEPIRAELFGIERLEQHAESLAAAQHVERRPTRDHRLERRLRDNEQALRAAYVSTMAGTLDARAIAPAADWLIDNFHVVQEQVRAIRIDLSPGFHRQLPRLSNGPFLGFPRVYGLAWAFVAHTDSRFDPQVLGRFLRAYQHVQPLTMGELWAVAIALRVVLVENLRRLSDDIVREQATRHAANALVDQVLGVVTQTAEAVLGHVAKPLPMAFSVQLARRLREEEPGVAPVRHWLDTTLAAQGTTEERVVEAQQLRQGAANVTIRNIITSMRMISSINWRDLFESVSAVDAILRPGCNFDSLDFETREQYRHAIEDLARGSRYSEIEITNRAVQAAEQACGAAHGRDAATARRADPGYYLIAKGRQAFEATIDYRVGLSDRLVRANTAVGISGYLGVVTVVTALVVAMVLAWNHGWDLGWEGIVLAFLGFVPASDAAMALVNCGATNRFTATRLPGLALADGVPQSLRTMVVMPVLLTSPASIEEQVKQLEVHHLASCDGDLCFALLSDWADSTTQTQPGDDALLRVAADGIAKLNARYGRAPGSPRFLLFHRDRRWNPAQRKWIGWERKRGKLHELNRLLRGATDTTFVPTDGREFQSIVPADVRYVIILDADTRLPRDAARRLIGKMAHPLNRPTLDAGSCRVIDGYAVMQPRVTPALPTGRDGSLFQRVFGNTGGMDPYACAVSDVYQDLFGEGSYCGKGIYDVDAFEAALAGRIPDNTVLSHDLLEGIFARAALVSDIELIDEFPTRYNVAVARQYRWARGDWQLLPWILGRGMPPDADHRQRAIPLVGRWKMIDNLRRSLSAPAAFLAFVAGWTLPFVDPMRWSAFVLVAIAIPALIPFLSAIIPRRLGLAKLMHLCAVGADLRLALSQILLLVAFLPHQACVMMEAIVRTVFRLLVSRRNLLEWTTAAQAKVSARLNQFGFYREMALGIGLTVAAATLVAWCKPGAWPIAAPFLVLWLLSPVIARWISRASLASSVPPISAVDTQVLRLIARRTWCYFETFVTPNEHMLPPDNFQEDPKPVVAHRTSPTNIGLYLLSVVASADFGWIGRLETVERLEATLQTMNQLERHMGHFYNWYDTSDLHPLEPEYISSVDSGNLAGHLVALWTSCTEWDARPVMDANWRVGIEDPLALLRQSLREMTRRPASPDLGELNGALNSLDTALRPMPTAPACVAAQLSQLAIHSEKIAALLRGLPTADPGNTDATIWADKLHAAVLGHQRTLGKLAPWAALLASDTTAVATDAALASLVADMPTLAGLPGLCATAAAILARRQAKRPTARDTPPPPPDPLIEAFQHSAAAAIDVSHRLLALCANARKLFDDMKFGFLFDRQRELLSIGYRVADGSLEQNFYDLLASEARLTSFVGIAKGDLPTRHWFRLGRAMTAVGSSAVLTSWSGSMFEYLMPSLVMRAPAASLLERTNRQAVLQQMKYGAARHVPWGASESAYNARDLDFTYQYSSFGVPGLSLKRDVGDSTVIAPYATALAAMVDPGAAAANFARLADAGGRGRYGWYEALDYTKARLPEGADERGRYRRRARRRGNASALPCGANDPGDGVAAAGAHAARRHDIGTDDRNRDNRHQCG
jgi:cyclic beta-1,2-glucan synthetase